MSNVILQTCASHSLAEGLRQILLEEDIPALVERSRTDVEEKWCVQVPEEALEHARRLLANREAMGSSIDWENLDVGEPTPQVLAELRTGPAIHVFASIIRWMGAILGLVILGLGLLGIVLAVIG